MTEWKYRRGGMAHVVAGGKTLCGYPFAGSQISPLVGDEREKCTKCSQMSDDSPHHCEACQADLTHRYRSARFCRTCRRSRRSGSDRADYYARTGKEAPDVTMRGGKKRMAVLAVGGIYCSVQGGQTRRVTGITSVHVTYDRPGADLYGEYTVGLDAFVRWAAIRVDDGQCRKGKLSVARGNTHPCGCAECIDQASQ